MRLLKSSRSVISVANQFSNTLDHSLTSWKHPLHHRIRLIGYSLRHCIISAAAASGVCYEISTKTSSPCLLEASPSDKRPRRRPPRFGQSIPQIAARDFSTARIKGLDDGNRDREHCPLCKKFGSGPCGEVFKLWLACTDRNSGRNANGDPLHLTACEEFAVALGECLETNKEYYEAYDKIELAGDTNDTKLMKESWAAFVQEIEDGLSAKQYKSKPFPEEIQPEIQIRLSSKTGAAFFSPNEHDETTILISAYMIDQRGDVIAAASKEDMDMGKLGCILQFNISDDLEFVTVRAIYDDGSDPVKIFTKIVFVPRK